MARIAYVNGAYRPLREAAVNIEDRATQFADAVYEVWAVRGGRMLDVKGHLARLARSLGELRIAPPMSDAALMVVLRETLRRNRVRDGMVYLQISRGVAAREHGFPTTPVAPTVIVVVKPQNLAALEAKARRGIRVLTAPDIRWGRCDIKTTGLLANALAKQHAIDAGCDDVWMVRADGAVSESSAANVWIVDPQGRLRTGAASDNILNGVTRRTVIAMAEARGLTVVEDAFTADDARRAREAFQTAASGFVMPVVEVDGAPIGQGAPGPLSVALRAAYVDAALER